MTVTPLRRLTLSLLAAVGLTVSGLAGTALAASTQSYQISPPTANYAGDPGTTVKGVIKVTNLTADPIALHVGKENFVAKGEEGEIELVDNANPLYSLAPWFTVPAGEIDIAARATKEVDYTLTIPVNAEPGGRYGSIVFSSVPPKLPSGVSGASVQQSLAGIVFARINGPANEQLQVASFSTSKSFAEYGPVTFNTRVKNTGNVHEKPTGTITIKNMFGMKVDTIALDEHYVIPDAIRHLKNDWPAKGKHKVLFGRYTAQLAASYSGGKTLSATTAFIIIPWKLLLIVFAILVVLFLIFWRGRKRFARAARILAGKE